MKNLGQESAQSGLIYGKDSFGLREEGGLETEKLGGEMGQSQPCDKRDQLGQLKGWDGFVRNLQGVWRFSGDLRVKEKGGVQGFRFGQLNQRTLSLGKWLRERKMR